MYKNSWNKNKFLSLPLTQSFRDAINPAVIPSPEIKISMVGFYFLLLETWDKQHMIWCCWHLAASFLFTVNTSHRPWSILLLVVSILLYAAIMHMAQSFHVNKNVSFSARNIRINPAILTGYCAELNGMWWGGVLQGAQCRGQGGCLLWVTRWDSRTRGQRTGSWCERLLLQPVAEKGLTAFVCFVGKMLCSRMPCECCWRLSFMLISVSVFIIFFFSGYPGVYRCFQ